MDERVTATSCSHSIKTFEDITKLLSANSVKFMNQDLKCSETCEYGVDKLWMCLECGFVGCGHYDNQHSTDHYKRSAHPLFMQLKSYTIWCFSCNVFVQVSKFPEFVVRKYREFGRRTNLNMNVSGQVIAPVVKTEPAQRQQKLQSLDLSVPGEVPIINSNSTCYAASVLQVLAHLSYFNRWFWALAAYLQQGSFSSEGECIEDILTSHFCQMMQVLQLPGKMNQSQCHFEAEKIHMQPFYRSLQAYNKQFLGDLQQDAQEFLMVIFDCVKRSLGRRFAVRQLKERIPFSQSTSVIRYAAQQIFSQKRDIISDCFEGIEIIQKDLKCASCGFVQGAQERQTFCILSLNVTKNQTSLDASLQKYCAAQLNEIACKNCQCQARMSSQSRFLYCPPVLCVHLLCFENEEEKIHTAFTQQSIEQLSLMNWSMDQTLHHQDFICEDDIPGVYRQFLAQRFAYMIAEQFSLRSSQKQYNSLAFAQLLEPLTALLYNLPESIGVALKAAQTCKVLTRPVPRAQDHHEARAFYVLECLATEYYDIAKFNQSKTEYFRELLQALSACKSMKTLRSFTQDELTAGAFTYELQGAVLHNGSLRSGHYTACCRAQQGWLVFDDAAIKNTQEIQIKEPYLLFYQKKPTIAQDAIQQDIYQQILASLNGQPCAKPCQEMYDAFFRYAIQYIYTFGQRLPFKLTDCSISGDWLYRLQQLPWARNPQFRNLDERFHQYAIQPAMVPCRVPVTGFLWQLIIAVFGDAGIEIDDTTDAGDDDGDKLKNPSASEVMYLKRAQRLFDNIISYRGASTAQFAVSRTFVRQLSENCFYAGTRPSYCNEDLIEPGAPPQRARLRTNLREHEDFVVVGEDEWRRIKQMYGGLELQMWQKDNIYGLPEALE